MNFNEYQELSRRTEPDFSQAMRIDNYVYGLNGEVGELTESMKKYKFHGHALVSGELRKEFGDVLWYFARLADEFGFPLEDIAKENIKKLKRRYPDTQEASRNRTE